MGIAERIFFAVKVRRADMQIGPKKDYRLELRSGFVMLGLPNGPEVKIGMGDPMIMVELPGEMCLGLDRLLLNMYLVDGPPAHEADGEPSIGGYLRWVRRQPDAVITTESGEQPRMRQDRHSYRQMIRSFDKLGTEANAAIVATLVTMDREKAALGNLQN
jgi:hypothetical protein